MIATGAVWVRSYYRGAYIARHWACHGREAAPRSGGDTWPLATSWRDHWTDHIVTMNQGYLGYGFAHVNRTEEDRIERQEYPRQARWQAHNLRAGSSWPQRDTLTCGFCVSYQSSLPKGPPFSEHQYEERRILNVVVPIWAVMFVLAIPLTLGLIHGRMRRQHRALAMRRLAAGVWD